MAHNVFCVKFKREMPGLDEPPFDNELGQKIYDNVSQEAWRQWMEHCKMLLNEYRLNPARREDQEVIVKQLEMFFFGEGSAKPVKRRSFTTVTPRSLSIWPKTTPSGLAHGRSC